MVDAVRRAVGRDMIAGNGEASVSVRQAITLTYKARSSFYGLWNRLKRMRGFRRLGYLDTRHENCELN